MADLGICFGAFMSRWFWQSQQISWNYSRFQHCATSFLWTSFCQRATCTVHHPGDLCVVCVFCMLTLFFWIRESQRITGAVCDDCPDLGGVMRFREPIISICWDVVPNGTKFIGFQQRMHVFTVCVFFLYFTAVPFCLPAWLSSHNAGMHVVCVFYMLGVGCGGLGLMGIQFAKKLTKQTVVAIDVNDEALEIAKEYGADFAVRKITEIVKVLQTRLRSRFYMFLFLFHSPGSFGKSKKSSNVYLSASRI